MILELIIFVLIVFIGFLIGIIIKLKRNFKELVHKKKSSDVIHGSSWEQFVPFMKNFPYAKEDFKFLGKPIDGIVFSDDEIVFLEFKTGQSGLSEGQRKIRQLVSEGKVRFEVMRY